MNVAAFGLEPGLAGATARGEVSVPEPGSAGICRGKESAYECLLTVRGSETCL